MPGIHQMAIHYLKMFQQMLLAFWFSSVYDHFEDGRHHRVKGMVNVKCRNPNGLLYWKKNYSSKLLQCGDYSLKKSTIKWEVLTLLLVLYSNSKKWFVTKILKLEIKSVLVLLYFLGFLWWSFDVNWNGGGGIWILCGFVNAFLMFLFSF